MGSTFQPLSVGNLYLKQVEMSRGKIAAAGSQFIRDETVHISVCGPLWTIVNHCGAGLFLKWGFVGGLVPRPFSSTRGLELCCAC